MDNVIYYFSGTGNSLKVAKDIAELMGNTRLVSIAAALKEGPARLTGERVGFVFPCYYALMPQVVERFISTLEFQKSQYVFGVVTFGGAYGMTLARLGDAVSLRGGALNAGFSVRMPGNFIVEYGAWPKTLQKIVLRRENKKAKRIALAAKAKKVTRIPKGSLPVRLTEKKDRKITGSFGKMGKEFHATDRCTACGVCEKICPVNNIKLEAKHPVWGDRCEQCEACIQWCPKQAVEYADLTDNRKRYRNPDITLSELLNNTVSLPDQKP